ncbi:MAG: PAS domain S-box protein [PVC group bacterium]|nr:PAS domain S-box protein [PVC group bacterium]
MAKRKNQVNEKNHFFEEELKREHGFSESIIKTAQIIILVLDREGRVVRFNPYMEKITGYKLKEVKGKDWFTTFLPEGDYDKIRKLFKKAIGNIHTKGNVNSILTKDKKEILIEWYDDTLRDKKGNIIGIVSLGIDITERKKVEKVLHESHKLGIALSAISDLNVGLRICLEAALDVSGMDCGAVYLFDKITGNLNVVFDKGLSPDFIKNTSCYNSDSVNVKIVMKAKPIYTQYEILGVPINDMEKAESLRAIAVIPIIYQKRVIGCLNVASHIFNIEQVSAVSREALESIVAQIGNAVARLQGEKELEQYRNDLEKLVEERTQQLVLAERLAATGRLAASIAHEINSPLQGMLLHLELMKDGLPGKSKKFKNYEYVKSNIIKIRDIVKQLLDIYRKTDAKKTIIDINDLIQKVAGLINYQLELKNISLELNLNEQLPGILGHEQQLHQVILNILLNSLDSIEGRGKIVVTTLCDKNYVKVKIKDNGRGIKQENIGHVFDPFFSTKKDSGVGLGLFVCKGLIKNHDGEITVEKNKTKGSLFIITLPRR